MTEETHHSNFQSVEIEQQIPRDVSWLAFNYRVLQEATDPTVPLMERIKFLAIYSSNLDEFFRVRVAHLRNLIRVGKKTKRKLEFDPETLLTEIQEIILRQQIEFTRIFDDEILTALRVNKIYVLRRLELNEEQIRFVEDYFNKNLLPFVQPVLLMRQRVRPYLNNAALYLAVTLQEKPNKLPPDSGSGHAVKASKLQYAIAKIPSDHVPRFVELPSPKGYQHIIMLDDIVRHALVFLFPGYNIIDSYSFKLTRDAELYIDDEFSGNLVDKIKQSLAKRNVGPAARFVYDREMPPKLRHYLQEMFDLDKGGISPEGRYHNNFDFFRFPICAEARMRDKLYERALTPMVIKSLGAATNIFEAIDKEEVLLNFPFHSYSSVTRFFDEAANDERVTAIKITQYRVSDKSPIMEALMRAAANGKTVTVFVEVKARFDEESNLRWAQQLEQAGVNVLYSIPGLKVHCKVALVTRTALDGSTQHYTYLSTGNFNEKTAMLYTDFGFFTTDPRLTTEAERIFTLLQDIRTKAPHHHPTFATDNTIETALPKTMQREATPFGFDHLLVGHYNLQSTLMRLIDDEITEAEAGRKAYILLKMNSIEDPRMIQRLYEASAAGVKIDLIIRGICCLKVGERGLSENINGISIIDRYLEHSRVFCFHHGGEELLYLSSADWMVRNMSHRIEVAFPIYSITLRKTIQQLLKIQLADNVKARIIDPLLQNEYQTTGTDKPTRSQTKTYAFWKRMNILK